MEKIIVGRIVNTFGIKGECKVEIITDFKEERFQVGKIFYVEDEKLVLKKVRYHKGFALLTFENLEDINLVEKYKEHDLCISLDDVKPLDDGYYFYQLKGLDVYGNNQKIGTVKYVESYPANNVLRVETNEKDVLIPFVKSFIEKVDLEEKRIDIKVIEGLL